MTTIEKLTNYYDTRVANMMRVIALREKQHYDWGEDFKSAVQMTIDAGLGVALYVMEYEEVDRKEVEHLFRNFRETLYHLLTN